MTRPLLAAAAALALLTACGDSSPSRTDADDAPAAAATASPSSAPAGGSAQASKGPAASTAASGPAAAPQQQQSGQPQPGSAQPPVVAAPGTKPAAQQRATAAGTYTYDSSGTITAGTPRQFKGSATLTVDRPAGGQQHSVLEGEQGRTEQDVVARSNGTYLARLSLTNPAFTKEFLPEPAVLLVPEPAKVGRAWSWTATSTDGKTKAAVTARITRTETLTIGGVRTKTAVIASTLRLTGDVTYTGRMETWYDPAHRLTVKDHTRGNGTVSGFAFTTDITSVLRSTRPA